MAAYKPEVVITQLLDKIATPFQRLTPSFGVQQPIGTIANSARCNRKSLYKMAAAKPEVLISQLPDKITSDSIHICPVDVQDPENGG